MCKGPCPRQEHEESQKKSEPGLRTSSGEPVHLTKGGDILKMSRSDGQYIQHPFPERTQRTVIHGVLGWRSRDKYSSAPPLGLTLTSPLKGFWEVSFPFHILLPVSLLHTSHLAFTSCCFLEACCQTLGLPQVCVVLKEQFLQVS